MSGSEQRPGTRWSLRPPLIYFSLLVLGACNGTIYKPGSGPSAGTGDGSGKSGDPDPGAGSSTGSPGTGGVLGGSGTGGMTMGMRTTPGDLPLPRLSHDEYIQTIKDLVTQVMPAAEATKIISAAIPLTTDLSQDALVGSPSEKHGGFSRVDQSEQQPYSDIPVAVAMNLGAAFTSSTTRIAALVGDCSKSGSSINTACLQTFVKSFGEIALRHTLSSDDVTFYAGTATSNPVTAADLAKVVAVMLSSPRFLYRVESGDQMVANNIYALDAWELAARLSYHFWGTMPDATLRDDARSGKLLTADGYTSEVTRLMADPRADGVIRSFFEEMFWPLLELPPLDSRVNDPVYKAFAGANLPTTTLRDHMVNDVLDAASWTVANGGTLSDLLTNRMSFAKDADLAALYGVSPWNGQGTPPMLPASRAGLLTRPAFLSTGTINTRPIMKGVFIRTTLLCDNIPPPPANAANTPITLTGNQTTREVVQTITEQNGTVCQSCHQSLINPLGFASENFDGLGRERTQQTFYDDSGKVTGMKAIDTTSIPRAKSDDTTMSTGMADLTQLIAKSGKVEPCVATRLFRFAFRRVESSIDADAIAGLTQLAQSGKLADLFKGVAMRPEFKQRVITP
ncbi:MAG TPA: DUF1588 domain-containing protein [Polyangia bacterium]